MVSSPVTSWLIIDRETTETVTDFIFLVSKIIVDRDWSFEELMLLNCGVGEDSWESLGVQGDPTSQS